MQMYWQILGAELGEVDLVIASSVLHKLEKVQVIQSRLITILRYCVEQFPRSFVRNSVRSVVSAPARSAFVLMSAHSLSFPEIMSLVGCVCKVVKGKLKR